MDKRKSIQFEALDIKVPIGNLIINILRLSYEAPRPSWYYKNHCHSGYELHFIPAGKGTVKVLDHTYNITPGTLYITGPEVFHEQKAEIDEPMSEYCINFEIMPYRKRTRKNDMYIEDEVESIFNTLKNTKFWFGKDEHISFNLFEKIMAEFENNIIGYYTYVQSLVLQIILNVVRCTTAEKRSSYFVPHKILNDSRRLLCDDYFRNYDRALSPKELSDLIRVSERQLNRIMQEYYSMTFKEKLTAIRLEEAKTLLLSSNLSVSEISEKTGFSSLSYFSRLFQKYFNMSPSQVKALFSNNSPY